MPVSTQYKRKCLRNKADRLLQQIVRKLYKSCMVCGAELSCGHHYYPKSTSSALRYNIKNMAPLCQGCHFSHHNGNPAIHNEINSQWGEERLEELASIKRNNLYTKTSLEYYNTVIKNLELITPYEPRKRKVKKGV